MQKGGSSGSPNWSVSLGGADDPLSWISAFQRGPLDSLSPSLSSDLSPLASSSNHLSLERGRDDPSHHLTESKSGDRNIDEEGAPWLLKALHPPDPHLYCRGSDVVGKGEPCTGRERATKGKQQSLRSGHLLDTRQIMTMARVFPQDSVYVSVSGPLTLHFTYTVL